MHHYIYAHSLVDEECFPYIAAPGHCKVQRTSTLSSVGCQLPSKVPRDHMYRVGPAYSLNNETDIMIEIRESGPVQGKKNKNQNQNINFSIRPINPFEIYFYFSYDACLSRFLLISCRHL